MAATKREPVETKVVAATGATAGGGVVATFVVWLLGVVWQGAPQDADHAAAAIGSVPAPVTALVGLTVVTASTFLGGYLAKHSPRESTVPDPEAVAFAHAGGDDPADAGNVNIVG